MYAFGLPDRVFGTSVWLLCILFVCVTFVTLTNRDKAGDRGDGGQGYPLPLPGQDTRKATPKQIFLFFQANFFYFFYPTP